MKRRRSCPPIQTGSTSFAGFRFPPAVILLAVRWIASGGNRKPAKDPDPVWIGGLDRRRFIPTAPPRTTCTPNQQSLV
jgi:hypothetical protein